MRQYLVVLVGIVVLIVAFVARSYLGKSAPAGSIEAVTRAGEGLTEGLAKAKPEAIGGLEPRFAALAQACAALGPATTPAAKQLCERAEVLRQAAKSGQTTPEGVRAVEEAMAALGREVGPAKK
jgi:hypothetical protein